MNKTDLEERLVNFSVLITEVTHRFFLIEKRT